MTLDNGRKPIIITHGTGGYTKGCRCEICKTSASEYNKEHHRAYYLANRERLLEEKAAYRIAHRDQYNQQSRSKAAQKRSAVLIHYSQNPPSCVCCGESRMLFLTIDHIEGGGSEHRRRVGRGRSFYAWLIKNDYPSGFQILCANCNQAKHFQGSCKCQEEMKTARRTN